MAEIYKVAGGVVMWFGQESDLNIENVSLELEPVPDIQWYGASRIQWV
jgi:hypothetical protein